MKLFKLLTVALGIAIYIFSSVAFAYDDEELQRLVDMLNTPSAQYEADVERDLNLPDQADKVKPVGNFSQGVSTLHKTTESDNSLKLSGKGKTSKHIARSVDSKGLTYLVNILNGTSSDGDGSKSFIGYSTPDAPSTELKVINDSERIDTAKRFISKGSRIYDHQSSLMAKVEINQSDREAYGRSVLVDCLTCENLSTEKIKAKIVGLTSELINFNVKIESMTEQLENGGGLFERILSFFKKTDSEQIDKLSAEVYLLKNNIQVLESKAQCLLECSHKAVKDMRYQGKFKLKISSRGLVAAPLVIQSALKKLEKITVFGDAETLYDNVSSIKGNLKTLESKIETQKRLKESN